MTTGIGPYVVPLATDTDVAANVFEATLTAEHAMVDIGGGVMAHAETFGGNIPGPTFMLNADDTLIVRLRNQLSHVTGIHWHGIELQSYADGTPFTQNGVPGVSASLPAGGTFLYKFKVPRPGLYWYHPHHHASTNQVFRGLYGMIVVADPHEAALIASGVLPPAADTKQVVLSDITVCKAAGSNDAATYPATLPWVGGGAFPGQPGPTPEELCETPTALDEDGHPGAPSFGAGDVPNIQQHGPGRTNEGQTVLTNGVNVGGRGGSPSAPGALAVGAHTLPVSSGQGLRLQIVNCATVRYFRLILTTGAGAQVPLVRVGGEGGLLDDAVVEGGVVGTFDTKYTAGEILLPPGSRADVVAAIPAGLPVGSVLTVWTQDFSRTGAGFANLPTVPVMHLEVAGAAGTTYTIAAGTPLRSSIAGASVEALGAATATLLDPATFSPAKPGMSDHDIDITNVGGMLGIDGVTGTHDVSGPYTDAAHLASSRYAERGAGAGDILELRVINNTGAHHPFHLHGFSMQPLDLTRTGFPTFTWAYSEFRDNIDVPSNYTLRFRIRLDDRPLADGVTPSGALGRWMFHCHIFFHAHLGMIGELVLTAPDGREKPYVNVGGSWAYTPAGGIATRSGTFDHPDGLAVTLASGTLTTSPFGTLTTGAGTWSWQLDSTGLPDDTHYVYITATDADGRRDQAVFRLKIGAPDDGADNGDPHIHTVDGTRYDFQAVGEFTLLRDWEGMELQARQTPVLTANPITDPYSGLSTCVSVNTAFAARVGRHRVAYQPGPEGRRLQFFLDGKPAQLPTREGLDLGEHRVTATAVSGGSTTLRIDYAHGPAVTVTPYYWNSHDLWLLNVSVSRTHAEEGVMGRIPPGSWLPALPNGQTVGPMPPTVAERYVQLYRTFADAWRVRDETSLFVYAPGTSTATFTDADWPAEEQPCVLKPQFEIPGAPVPAGMTFEQAEEVCKGVTLGDLHIDCVFDVAATGDEVFALGYLLTQELRLRGSAVQIVADKPQTRYGEPLTLTATVSPTHRGGATPAGNVTFIIDGAAAGPPVRLDAKGRARLTTDRLTMGEHRIRASYASDGGQHGYDPSTSPNLLHTVGDGPGPQGGTGTDGDAGTGDGTGTGCRPAARLWIILLLVVVALILLYAYLF